MSSSWEWSPCAFHHQNHLLELCLESPGPLFDPEWSFCSPRAGQRGLGWIHPSRARWWYRVPGGSPGAWRACGTCQGTNKWWSQKLLMRVGCEPVPGALSSRSAAPAASAPSLPRQPSALHSQARGSSGNPAGKMPWEVQAGGWAAPLTPGCAHGASVWVLIPTAGSGHCSGTQAPRGDLETNPQPLILDLWLLLILS